MLLLVKHTPALAGVAGSAAALPPRALYPAATAGGAHTWNGVAVKLRTTTVSTFLYFRAPPVMLLKRIYFVRWRLFNGWTSWNLTGISGNHHEFEFDAQIKA